MRFSKVPQKKQKQLPEKRIWPKTKTTSNYIEHATNKQKSSMEYDKL